MGNCFLYGNDGKNILNFQLAGNPRPNNPKENTIWLNTDKKITGWYFSATQPEKMAEGEVWIGCGNSSNVAFNALKKNTIQAYPMYAKQWINGALVDLTAQTYQSGKWVEWTISYALIPSSGLFTDINEVTEQADGTYRFYGSNTLLALMPFDVKDYKTMTIEGSYKGFKGMVCIGLFSEPVVSSLIAGYSHDFSEGGDTIDVSYDISNVSGSVYFGVGAKQNHEELQTLDCTLTEVTFKT